MSTIGGVSSSGNAWATLSAQRSQHQAKMFAKVDTDGSGSVDQSELSAMLSDISQKTGTSLGDSKQLFSKMDTNGDGSLSSDELGQGMKELLPPPTTMDFAQSHGQGGQSGQSGQGDDLFSKVDSNGDGTIDSSELKVLTDKIKSDTGQDVSSEFSKLDANGDGSITQSEFDAGRPQGPGAGDGAQSAQGMPPPPPSGAAGAQSASSSSSSTTYDPLDANQDGTVSSMERLAGMLKELAQASDSSDSSGSSASSSNSEVAKLAQKLYEQISASLQQSGSSTTSTLSATA